MFSPKDSGLQLPLTHKLYHGRRVICDAVGNELFLLEMIRSSIDAKQMLDEWMQAICDKFNGTSQTEKKEVVPDPQPVQGVQSMPEPPKKRGRGRPRKSAK